MDFAADEPGASSGTVVEVTDEHVHPGVALGLKCVVAAGPPGSRSSEAFWVGGFGTEGVPIKSWQSYDTLRFRALPGRT